MEELYELAEQYANSVLQDADFLQLLELKKRIKEELRLKIVAFKTAEAKYLEAKSYGIYHPNLKEYQLNFMDKKAALFSEPLVKEYKEYEARIQKRLDEDLKALKNCVSNKFK